MTIGSEALETYTHTLGSDGYHEIQFQSSKYFSNSSELKKSFQRKVQSLNQKLENSSEHKSKLLKTVQSSLAQYFEILKIRLSYQSMYLMLLF